MTPTNPDFPRATAVITGASRGIGRAIARRLAPSFDIVAVARHEPALRELAAEIQSIGGACTPVAADVTDLAAVSRALSGVAADVLVNNAGVGIMKPFLDTTPDEWRAQVDTNLNALYYVTRALLPGMVARGRGHIIVIGSITGRTAFPGGVCYAATKHAVMGFTESLMLEVRDAGVKVSVVMPGSVDTDFFDADGAGRAGRVGRDTSWKLRAEDVADAVAEVIDTPQRALIHRLEIRASQPKKK